MTEWCASEELSEWVWLSKMLLNIMILLYVFRACLKIEKVQDYPHKKTVVPIFQTAKINGAAYAASHWESAIHFHSIAYGDINSIAFL
ncbi:hypothetical protein ANACOL_00672 [Anaerotruncus colihominis DSM 17241]|uniref:Uncharacterized protein n=2 Tax=Anaerotruncus colihominis TaxID=169435 RepID=B0P7E2_9FIRM|nr:hypothetical protein ANACOL_00672 [Anaerotruncus colihominis DSM 17241]